MIIASIRETNLHYVILEKYSSVGPIWVGHSVVSYDSAGKDIDDALQNECMCLNIHMWWTLAAYLHDADWLQY